MISRRQVQSNMTLTVMVPLDLFTLRILDCAYTICLENIEVLIYFFYSILPVVGNWTATLEGIGIPRTADSNGGEGWGAFIATSSINPSNWTRSYSRSAYIDPLPNRPNLSILANATVTRLIFSSSSPSNNLTASGVEYAATRGGAKKTVNVRKEVILAGGAIGSPHILMHSGVGPKDVLDAAGVSVNVELPGVGQHLQDHIVSALFYFDAQHY